MDDANEGSYGGLRDGAFDAQGVKAQGEGAQNEDAAMTLRQSKIDNSFRYQNVKCV
jgi:hypothetical protein